jgi:hypothetical protein
LNIRRNARKNIKPYENRDFGKEEPERKKTEEQK